MEKLERNNQKSNTLIKNWKTIKKSLPHNWVQQVVQTLADKGFNYKPDQVQDIRRGKNKNPEDMKKVLQAIRLVKARHQRQKTKIEAMKKAL